MPGRQPSKQTRRLFRIAALAAAFCLGRDARAIDVANQTDWNTAVVAVAAAGTGSTVTINFTGDFTLTSSLARLQASNSSVTVNIVGAGHTVDGASSFQGIYVLGTNSPAVTISNLTLANTLAKGSNGLPGQAGYFSNSLSYGSGGGGGGGLGAGGGLYVDTNANVTLTSVSFTNNSAKGGNGGAGGTSQNTASDPVNGGNGGDGGAANAAGTGGGGAGGTGGHGSPLQGTGGTNGVNTGDGGGGAGGSGTTAGDFSTNNTPGSGNSGGGAGGGSGDGTVNRSGAPGADGGRGGNGGGAFGGAIYVASGGTLVVNDSPITNATLTTGTGGTGGSGGGSGGVTGNNGGAGVASGQNLYVASNTTLSVDATTSPGGIAYNGTISGTAGIIKSGTGTLTLSAANTYGGTTAITAGTLQLSGGTNRLPTSTALSISNAGIFDLNGQNQTISSLSSASALASITLGSATLSVNQSTNTTYAGGISGTGGFTKLGVGTLLLSGTNTYSGATTIASGTLQVSGGSAIGDLSGVTLANSASARLNLNGSSETIGPLAGGGSTGGVVALGNGTLTVGNSTNTTFAGVISGAGGSLIKQGTDTLVLNRANTYTGGTTVNSGILREGVTNAFVNNTAYTVNGGTLDINGFSLTASAFSGTGGTVNLGTGTFTLNGSAPSNFDGSLTGASASTLHLTGSSVLLLGGDNSNFLGTATLDSGTRLAINSAFGGSVTVDGMLAGSGTIAGNVTVQNGTIAPSQNAAIITNTPNPTPTTLTIGGNYVQQSTGTYRALINAAGQSDRLNITGTATLDGTLTVHALSGHYSLGSSYTILHAAGGITGRFSQFNEDLPMVQLSLAYHGNDVVLNIPAPPPAPPQPGMPVQDFTPAFVSPTFASFGRTFNQIQIGQALDTIRFDATGATANLINQLTLQNTAGIQSGLQQLNGELIGSLATVKIESSDLFLRSTTLHLRQLTGYPIGAAPSTFAPPQTSVALPASDPTGVQRASYAPERELTTPTASPFACPTEQGARISGWLQGIGAAGSLSSNGNAAGLDYSIGGTAFGVDLQGDDAVLGIAGGYGHTYVGQNENLGNGQIDTLHLDVYALKRLEHLYLFGLVGYANDDFSTRRYLNIGDISSTARGSYMGNELNSYAEAGINIPVGGWTLQPLMGIRYLLLGQNAFTEYGGAGADLTVGSQTYDSLRYSFGARLSRVCEVSTGTWTPYLEGRWTHEVLDNSRLVDAQFAGITGGSFTSAGNVLGRDFGEFGAGFVANVSQRVQVYLGYDAQVSSRQSAHGGTAGFQVSW
jgi:autotransporter-associated beta strand protein